ncbi:MAG: aldo/keto reductase [Thermoplasmata archaeon]|nr:aldo/keto reductase [Thermoplasmata archaeon]
MTKPKAKAPAPKPKKSTTVAPARRKESGVDTYPLKAGPKPHPALGLGLWGLGRWSRDDEVKTRATTEHALRAGVTWFDTAEVYGTGRSERLLGDVLTRSKSDPAKLFLTTKVSWEHLRAGQVRAAVVGSLQKLERRSVDLVLVHAPDAHVPIAETMGALETLWKEGKVGAIGVSNFSVEELADARAALKETDVVVNQVVYNLFDREDGDGVLDYCRKNGIVVEAYTPLLRGLLAGRYLDGETPSPEVRRFAHHLLERDRFDTLVAHARSIRDLAKEDGVPMASIALHWLRRRGAAVIFGASRPEQVDAVLDAWAHSPSDATLDRADAIAKEVTRA